MPEKDSMLNISTKFEFSTMQRSGIEKKDVKCLCKNNKNKFQDKMFYVKYIN